MTLNFPNLSRSYEARQNRVRFWGYDSAREITFFLDIGALAASNDGAPPDEDSVLAAFDARIERIHAAARKVYGASRTWSDVHVLSEGEI
tara:strand:- start:4194 stop:4463 length:270 start_codon:yes stop_codon:yes gene_type:complete